MKAVPVDALPSSQIVLQIRSQPSAPNSSQTICRTAKRKKSTVSRISELVSGISNGEETDNSVDYNYLDNIEK